MGRLAVVLLICIVVIIYVRYYQQSDAASGSMLNKDVVQSHQEKRYTTQHSRLQQKVTESEVTKPPRRVLLQWENEFQMELQGPLRKEQTSESPAIDDDSPLHVQLPIPTEADNSSEELTNRTVKRNKLFIELPTNSSCLSSVNWLCHNETEKGSCSDENVCNSSSTLIMGGVQPDTLYILKANNDSVSDCDLRMPNCSDRVPTIDKYSTEAIVPGFDPGPLDLMWSPSQEKCKRELVYIYRLKVEAPGNPEWRDIQRMRELLPCRSLMCINTANGSDDKSGYSVQMRMLGADEGFDAAHIWPDERMSLCARLAFARRAARAKYNASAADAAYDLRAGSAWMSGLWAALGAAGGLALITLLGICYFDRRSRAAREEKEESMEETANPNLQVASGPGGEGRAVRHIPIVL